MKSLNKIQSVRSMKKWYVGYLEAGNSIRWTAHQLNMSKSTVERWWNRYRQEGHVKDCCSRSRGTEFLVSRLYGEWSHVCNVSICVGTVTNALWEDSCRTDQLCGHRYPKCTNVIGNNGLRNISVGVQSEIEYSGLSLDFADSRVRVRWLAKEWNSAFLNITGTMASPWWIGAESGAQAKQPL